MRTTFRAAVLGFGLMLTGSFVLPAEAMPVPQQPQVKTQSDVQVVRDHGKKRVWRHRSNRGHKSFRARNHHGRNHAWSGRHGNYHSWRGHRGYRNHRPGYRRYNGFWFPPAAFSVGVIVGPRIRVGNSHTRWCASHYGSYRRSDNTFQPYNGPRQACVSPYAR